MQTLFPVSWSHAINRHTGRWACRPHVEPIGWIHSPNGAKRHFLPRHNTSKHMRYSDALSGICGRSGVLADPRGWCAAHHEVGDCRHAGPRQGCVRARRGSGHARPRSAFARCWKSSTAWKPQPVRRSPPAPGSAPNHRPGSAAPRPINCYAKAEPIMFMPISIESRLAATPEFAPA